MAEILTALKAVILIKSLSSRKFIIINCCSLVCSLDLLDSANTGVLPHVNNHRDTNKNIQRHLFPSLLATNEVISARISFKPLMVSSSTRPFWAILQTSTGLEPVSPRWNSMLAAETDCQVGRFAASRAIAETIFKARLTSLSRIGAAVGQREVNHRKDKP